MPREQQRIEADANDSKNTSWLGGHAEDLIEAVRSVAENRFEPGGARPIMLPASARALMLMGERASIDAGAAALCLAGYRSGNRNIRASFVPANSSKTLVLDGSRWYQAH